MLNKYENIVVCDCENMEHIVRFMYYDGNDPEDDFVYVHYFLQHESLPRRVVNAIKYVLGFKSRYGHFGEVLINRSKATELIKFFKEFIDGPQE